MALTIAAADPSTVDWRGGTIVTLTGVFPTGEDLWAYLGPVGDFTDESCYMGTYGGGYAGRSLDGVTLDVVTPRLTAADIGALTLSVYSTTAFDSIAVDVAEGCFSDVLFEFRTRWPDFYDVGPRSMEQEPDQS